jgi:hypothetical protein
MRGPGRLYRRVACAASAASPGCRHARMRMGSLPEAGESYRWGFAPAENQFVQT